MLEFAIVGSLDPLKPALAPHDHPRLLGQHLLEDQQIDFRLGMGAAERYLDLFRLVAVLIAIVTLDAPRQVQVRAVQGLERAKVGVRQPTGGQAPEPRRRLDQQYTVAIARRSQCGRNAGRGAAVNHHVDLGNRLVRARAQPHSQAGAQNGNR